MKFAKRYLLALLLLLSAALLVACKDEPVDPENTAPVLSGVVNATIAPGSTFNPLAGVSATDTEDGDLTADIVVDGTVNVDVEGSYTLTYTVEDSEGLSATAQRVIVVSLVETTAAANYQEGVDLSKLPAEEKGVIFAALESYLLDNVYGGIPLYTGASRVMYSSRTQLYSPTYNSVMGFGTAFSQFSADDSTVEFEQGVTGNAGEYTWRTSFSTNPVTFNPWLSDDSSTSDIIDMYTGSLYGFYFDESRESYQILPVHAESDPVAVGGEVVGGKTYAKVWRIPVKDGLKWTFHPDIDTSGFAAGYADLDANDYVDTWKLALSEGWFRAISGGGDFLSDGIVGAAEYVADPTEANWANVGLKVVDGNTIELTFVSDKTAFDVKYSNSEGSKPALNLELLDALGEDALLGPDSIAASGVYYLDLYQPDQLLTFVKNDNFADADSYHFTGQYWRFINDSDLRFEEFLAGRLESASVPSAEVENYLNDPRVKVAPDPTTWRMSMNMFGTTAARDAYIAEHPELGLSTTYEPEPILAYLDFRQALYYGFDRYNAAINVVGTYLPAHTYYTSTYFLDAEGGIGVRGTDAGQAVSDDHAGATNGYVPSLAVALFKAAVAEAIADGFYEAGTPDEYTEIELKLIYATSGNSSAAAMFAQMVRGYEALLVDDTNYVRVVFNEEDVEFPGNYYDYILIGATDLGIGGISGSLLDAPDFMQVFRDDNFGGFTMDWGIDTTTANIVVTYNNIDGEEVTEKWSFNALVSALNGLEFVRDGQIQEFWSTAEGVANAAVQKAGETPDTINADSEGIAEYIVGDLADLATELEVESVVSYIVVSEEGGSHLVIIAKDGDNYSLVERHALKDNAEDAIRVHNSGYTLNYLSEDPLTVEQLNAIPYMAANYDPFASLDDVFASVDVPAGVQAYVYETGFNDYAHDAYVVIYVGGYYIGWTWL